MSTSASEPLSPLFEGLFDDAALFPPASIPLRQALELHGHHLRSTHADLVASFVCPSTRLTELSEAVAAGDADSVAVSLTLPGGRSELAEVLRSIADYPWLRLAAIELPVPVGELPEALDDLRTVVDTRGCAVFVEVPVADLTTAITDQLAGSGLGLKLRTGGATTEAFPGDAVLAAAISTAVRSPVPFKCTAGLHNALGHRDRATGFDHHGFLNVLLAVHAAQTGSVTVQNHVAVQNHVTVQNQLTARDPDAVASRVRALSPEDVRTIRAQFRSIGSCSIDEPLADLTTLGLGRAA